MPSDDAQEYIDDMAKRRGYVLKYHSIMAEADFPTLRAANELVNAAYLKDRALDRRTKELLFILSLTVLRASHAQIVSHIQVALDLGVSPQEILEAIEIALPEAGIVAFQVGLDAWESVIGMEGLSPSDETQDSLVEDGR